MRREPADPDGGAGSLGCHLVVCPVRGRLAAGLSGAHPRLRPVQTEHHHPRSDALPVRNDKHHGAADVRNMSGRVSLLKLAVQNTVPDFEPNVLYFSRPPSRAGWLCSGFADHFPPQSCSSLQTNNFCSLDKQKSISRPVCVRVHKSEQCRRAPCLGMFQTSRPGCFASILVCSLFIGLD